jgi:hypothetical protein
MAPPPPFSAAALRALVALAAVVAATASAPARKWLDGFSGVADAAAVVTQGLARFSVLTASIIRIEVHPAGAAGWDDTPSVAFVNRRTKVPPFTVTREKGALVIKTDSVELTCTGSARAFLRARARTRSHPALLFLPAQTRARRRTGATRWATRCR